MEGGDIDSVFIDEDCLAKEVRKQLNKREKQTYIKAYGTRLIVENS